VKPLGSEEHSFGTIVLVIWSWVI